jgi:hypothetical protein
MTKAQTRRREAVLPQTNNAPRFEIVRDGEPLPEIAHHPMRKAPVRRARHPREAETMHCPLCDGAITRFDMEVYEQHDRCAPCHEALS